MLQLLLLALLVGVVAAAAAVGAAAAAAGGAAVCGYCAAEAVVGGPLRCVTFFLRRCLAGEIRRSCPSLPVQTTRSIG